MAAAELCEVERRRMVDAQLARRDIRSGDVLRVIGSLDQDFSSDRHERPRNHPRRVA